VEADRKDAAAITFTAACEGVAIFDTTATARADDG
jgi:hypothetical protein